MLVARDLDVAVQNTVTSGHSVCVVGTVAEKMKGLSSGECS